MEQIGSASEKFGRRHKIAALLAAAILGLLLSSSLVRAYGARAPDAVTADGGRYYGPLVDGKREGQGRIEWDNGARYEGHFTHGLYAGQGRYRSPSGYVYEGQFKDGVIAGHGRHAFPSGVVYVGDYENDAFNGRGRYQAADGAVYEGDFVKGDFTGVGTYRAKSGAQHTGHFLKWQPHGKGRFVDAKGNVYEGDFVAGQLSSAGTFIGIDGTRYEGEFKNWQYHGKGSFRYANGDVYRGMFADGLFEGKGVLTYAAAQQDGRTEDRGTWRYGALDDPAAERQKLANVETALYRQRPLLDKALAGLAPSDPGRINLYLLAVAGDGAQEVFRRETQFVREQFDRDYGTRGRSLVLANSRSTVGELPMATLTSIRESLAAIAQRMDRDRDILFLFLTSHGSRTHEFSLAQNGMTLANLPAKTLGDMLKESGIRWKVVVVSACYSGGFIDPLKDDHTLIMTAARRDRTSFGCADENDFTYFGKAYFKEALPASRSFAEAFSRAKILVADWEKADVAGEEGEVTHSEPQIHQPRAILQYLERWQQQLRQEPKYAGIAHPMQTAKAAVANK